jgi:general secretion pathway protein M
MRMPTVLLNFQMRYRTLPRRDRVALNGLVVFLGLLLLYFGVWVPANDFFESERAERDRQLGLLQYMRASEPDARALAKPTTGGSSGAQPLLTQVSQTAQKHGIPPNRLQPEGNEGVSVWYDGVSFNDLVTWLEAEANEGVIVRQISIDRHGEPGKVNARIVLRN